MNENELHALIDALLDGDLSEADFVRLEAELQVDPKAREAYYARLKLNTLLEIESEAADEADTVATFPRHTLSWKRLGLVAAAVVAIGASSLVGWMAGNRAEPRVTNAPKEEPAASGFGVVAETADAMWAHTPFDRGDLLPASKLQLESGLVKLDLFSGVTVIFEGPSEFQLLSPMEMRVDAGKVRAVVPKHAEGFRISTHNGELVDLGTEFALEVSSGRTDVHVIDGEVEWHPATSGVRRLHQGEALRWTSDGQAAALEVDPRTVADVEESLEQQRAERRARWLEHVEKTGNDPRLVAYFPMRSIGNRQRRLPDASPKGADGTIVRASRVADRWDHPAGALDFSPTGSRARVVLSETYRSLTFVCWAKIDSLDRWFNSLFLTDGHELNEPHWQIMDDGRLFFSVKKREWKSKREPDKHIFYSPPVWDHTMSGKWIQIATVYDVDDERVTHYIDGKPVSRERVPDDYLVESVKIGAASIGNWAEPRHRTDPHFAVRNLNGSIDEFAIYAAALADEEIAQLYEIGKP